MDNQAVQRHRTIIVNCVKVRLNFASVYCDTSFASAFPSLYINGKTKMLIGYRL